MNTLLAKGELVGVVGGEVMLLDLLQCLFIHVSHEPGLYGSLLELSLSLVGLLQDLLPSV